MRLFVALVPPEDALEDLAAFLAPRQESEPAFRWTAPGQRHVTLAFMADVAEHRVADLSERLARAARRRTPLELVMRGGGAFPGSSRAKVLYTGVDAGTEGEELRRLSVGSRAAAAKAGAPPDGRRFHAHVTLARLRTAVDVSRWIRILDAYRGPAWTADEISLIRSHIGEGPRRGLRYDVVGTFPLGS